MTDVGWSFVKGHGTGNDVVLLPDLTGALDRPVARLCATKRASVGEAAWRTALARARPVADAAGSRS